MNKLAKILGIALFLLVMPLQQFGQTVKNNIIEIELSAITNPDFRYCLLSSIANDDELIYTVDEENSSVLLTTSQPMPENQFQAYFDNLMANADTEFNSFLAADKEMQGASFSAWKENLPQDLFVLLFRQMLIENPVNRDGNQTCATADPFCTTDVVSFYIDASVSGSCESGPDYGCMTPYIARPPYWFYMKIGVAGTFTIQITNSNNNDLDFCAWGPFTDPVSPCTSQLTSDKIIDCDSPYNSVQECTIPASSQVGQYYLLVITRYSSGSTTVTFSKVPGSGPGETDCGILPPMVENDGPYCVGETIHLTANGQTGASYSWTGPNGFSSTQQNPTIHNCTMAHSGTYTCTISIGSATNSATTEVVVIPQPTANFNYTSECRGTPTQFTSTSTTNPPGQQIQSYQWNFGDGQTGSGQSVTHTYANAGNYTVTLTTSCGNGHCTSTKTQTVPVYAAPVAAATANPSTVIYGGVSTLTATAGTTGSFNFHWEPANMVVNPNAQTTQTVPLQATQTYTVTVTNPQGGCSSTAQVTVSMEGSNMTAHATADQNTLCEGESTTLHAYPSGGTGNYTYSWTPANTLNNANIQNPVATPPVGTTTYTCAVSDGITSQNVNVSVTVYPNMESDIYQTICENQTYQFFDQALQAPGVYSHTIETTHGCDSTIHLHLDNWDIYETPITRHFCQGESYNFFGNQLSSGGIYYHTLESVHGCDSTIKLNLIQDPVYEIHLTESTCQGGPGYYFAPLDMYFPPSPYPNVLMFETAAGCDSIVFLTVEEAEYNSKTYNVSLCATEYTWGSNGMTYYESGTYYDTLSFPNSCDSTLTLNLELRPSFNDNIEVTSCDKYRWKNDTYGVDMTFEESTVYTHHYSNAFGCDSEATLYLTINDHDEVTLEVPVNESCDSYLWDPQGHEYTPGSIYVQGNAYDPEDHVFNISTHGTPYVRTYKNIHDCDSVVSMYVTFEYTPHPTPIYPMDATNDKPHWVVTATEFQINSYDFNLWDENPNCHWDTVLWTCDEAPEWILEPFGDRAQCCKLYVLGYVPDTIWLKAYAYNECAGEGIEQKYWLKSSFYGIEEQATNMATFDIVPNPNNGQMTLNFEYLTGKTNIRVYNMLGTIIDQFETYNSIGANTYQYDMKTKADGIYFFVATSKEGTIAKKVVIQH